MIISSCYNDRIRGVTPEGHDGRVPMRSWQKKLIYLSVIVPVYNEKLSIKKVLERVGRQKAFKLGVANVEVIVVDDGSNDGTQQILRKFSSRYKIIFHKRNLGLTAAMVTGLKEAKGKIILVQHADLEYHPKDWLRLVEPLLANQADMIMGSRYLRQRGKRHFSIRYQLGGQGLTILFNLLYGTKFTDIFTAHRAFTRKVLSSFRPRGKRFAFETELTAHSVKKNFRIIEVPITYEARDFQQGKKLRWHAAIDVIYAMIRTRFS